MESAHEAATGNSGYLHPLYAQSLAEFGEPLLLPRSKGWILKRVIPGTSHFDGMGCYPIFACEDWSNLEKDLDWVGGEFVCASLVADPFGRYTQEQLSRCFKDIARPYKQHFVVDLTQRPEDFVVEHHRRNSRRALERVRIEVSTEPVALLEEWDSLYNNLIERHQIKGIPRFSRAAFARQLRVPGIVAFRAVVDQATVGMALWYVQGETGYYHLAAYSADGYQAKASFAVFWTLLGYFADAGLKWLSLGAGAGSENDQLDGLTRFKRGWSTGTRTAYFCGRIFDAERYQEILRAKGVSASGFFPAYRLGEF